MKKLLLFSIILLLLGSCYQDQSENEFTETTTTNISEEKMAEILTDFYLVQSNLRYLQERRIPFEGTPGKLHYLIFKKHDISVEEFEVSFTHYKYNLEAYDRIMEKVLENLSKIETEVNKNDTVS